jgi:PKD repeat protein
MISKARPLHGVAAAVLVLVPLTLIQCKHSNNNTLTAPQTSGSLTVSIGASPTSGRAPLEVALTSSVSGGTGTYIYSWSLGDGSASSDANPHVRFASGGVYNVTLRVVSGSESVISSAVSVRVDGDVRLACLVDPEEGSAPQTVSFQANALGGNGQISYLWSFGDGATAAVAAPQHTYSSPGTYLARLTATSGAASATCAAEVHVFGTLKPQCKATPQGALGVKFNVVPNFCFHTGGCTYFWDFGDGQSVGGLERPLHFYGTPGAFTATATVKTGRTVGTCSINVKVG